MNAVRPTFWIESSMPDPSATSFRPIEPGRTCGDGPALALPPLSFQPAGDITWARQTVSPHESRVQRRTPAQHNGLRYEAKVHARLRRDFQFPTLESNPWFVFANESSRWRYCSPDAILTLDDVVTLVEVKYRFISEAYWKLTHLYRPVVARARGLDPHRIRLVAVARSYDPWTGPLPGVVTLSSFEDLSSPSRRESHALRDSDEEVLSVIVWKG